jgi:hypothetical protein
MQPLNKLAPCVIGLLLSVTSAAHAQILPGADNVNIVGVAPTLIIPVQDQPAEQSLADIDTKQLPPIVQSVTAAGGAGIFQGQAPFLNQMMQTLASGIPDAATYAAYFAGWVDFGPNAALLAATITNQIIQTDLNTLTVYQSLAADFDAEDGALNQIEACNQAAGAQQSVLYALQCTNEAIINLSQHIQLLELAQLVRGINEVVHRGYGLNADAQSGANMQTWLTQAAQH